MGRTRELLPFIFHCETLNGPISLSYVDPHVVLVAAIVQEMWDTVICVADFCEL